MKNTVKHPVTLSPATPVPPNNCRGFQWIYTTASVGTRVRMSSQGDPIGSTLQIAGKDSRCVTASWIKENNTCEMVSSQRLQQGTKRLRLRVDMAP